MAAGSTYTPIVTQTLSSDTASVTFSSIPTTYTDLVLVVSGYVNTVSYMDVRVGNGSADSGSNYSFNRMIGYSGGPYTDRYTNYSSLQPNLSSGATGTLIMNFQNYSNTTTYKTVLWRGSQNGTATEMCVGAWASTSAINYIAITGGSSNTIKSGTTFTLYGIAAA